ncbi:MAG: GBS Bsp-like repeat-containing protein [Mediterraneibacter gnavus]
MFQFGARQTKSDIVWYQADRQSDGTYKTVVKTKNHSQKRERIIFMHM